MTLRRVLFASLALALAGCNEDPQVIIVAPATGGISISLVGGAAAVTDGSLTGTGGQGGAVTTFVVGDLRVGDSTVAPVAPTAPTPPAFSTSTGTDILALPSAVTTGHLFVQGSLSTSGPATLTTTNGDIVISGTLRASAPADTITLSATAGTVYISGSIITSNTGGAPNGLNGAALVIHAQRIVITGTIDTRGESVTTGDGGTGGDVTVDMIGAAAGSHIYFISGTINVSGGSGKVLGGPGGNVSLTANNTVHAYGIITSNGGAAGAAGDNDVLANTGGKVTLVGGGQVDLLSTVTLAGGAGTTTGQGASGGMGGILNVDSPGGVRIYSSISMPGGAATASAPGLGIVAGAGGVITVGGTTKPATLEIGRGNVETSGGTGTAVGGLGGTQNYTSDQGALGAGCAFTAKGGSGVGPAAAAGATGGGMLFRTDTLGAGNHALVILSIARMDTSGGSGVAAGIGQTAGNVTFSARGDITVQPTNVTARGGSSDSGNAGGGGAVLIQTAAGGTPVGDFLISGAFDLQGGSSNNVGSLGGTGGAGGSFTATNTGAPGEIVSSAVVATSGGAGAQAGDGGTAGAIAFAAGAGTIASTGNLSALGGAGNVGTGKGGAGNAITFNTTNGSIVVSGILNVSGGAGSGAASGGAGSVGLVAATNGSILLSGTVTASGGGNLTSTAAAGGAITLTAGATSGIIDSTAGITAVGGSSIATTGTLVAGGGGGSLSASALSASGTLTLESTSTVLLDGGNSTGTALAGGGGTVGLRTKDLFISISGSVQARGGTAIDAGGAGGLGGQMVCWSNSDGDALGGDITLQSGSLIDVSGGAGTVGGSARNDATTSSVTPGGALVAVQFDADATLTTTTNSATGGRVQNLGTITAAGQGVTSLGGDVLFDGRDATGGAVTTPAAGAMTISGGISPGDFIGQ